MQPTLAEERSQLESCPTQLSATEQKGKWQGGGTFCKREMWHSTRGQVQYHRGDLLASASCLHQLVQDVGQGDHAARHQPLIAHIHPASASTGRAGAGRFWWRISGLPVATAARTPLPAPAPQRQSASYLANHRTCATGWLQSCPAPRAEKHLGCSRRQVKSGDTQVESAGRLQAVRSGKDWPDASCHS